MMKISKIEVRSEDEVRRLANYFEGCVVVGTSVLTNNMKLVRYALSSGVVVEDAQRWDIDHFMGTLNKNYAVA